jgi:hypothetical protein
VNKGFDPKTNFPTWDRLEEPDLEFVAEVQDELGWLLERI